MGAVNKLDSTKRKIYFFLIRRFFALKQIFFKKESNHFLFILSPPFSGSTLLNQILSTSKNISCNNIIGLREGQHLPKAKELMFHDKRWDADTLFNWKEIKKIWLQYWDGSKAVFLEKSPPNIVRAFEIEKVFNEVKFICLVRNPYSQVEGKTRRHNKSVGEATNLILTYLQHQKKNIENLKNVLFISYEQLTENPEKTKRKIIAFLPELSDIKMDLKYKAHNFKTKSKMEIINLNQEKIDNLTGEQIETINHIFEKEKELLDYFDYQIVKR